MRKIKARGIAFEVKKEPRNIWLFHPVKEKPNTPFSDLTGFYEFMGMRQLDNFDAECTNDTFVYQLPFRLDEWNKRNKLAL